MCQIKGGIARSPKGSLIAAGPAGQAPIRYRLAMEYDAGDLAELVRLAYTPYVEELGFTPGPLRVNYGKAIEAQRVTLAEAASLLLGVLIVDLTPEGFLIENVAVRPEHQSRGVGAELLRLAEAKAKASAAAQLYLFTHERMARNIAIYEHLGFEQYDRRVKDGNTLVFMRKQL